jgi:hypothetical protein
MKQNLKFVFLLFCNLGLLAGCATGGISQFAPAKISKNYPQRTPAKEIELYRTQLPTKKYEEIGVVNACCGDDTSRLIERLRTEASAHGGDGLIGLEVQATGGATASVIRFLE